MINGYEAVAVTGAAPALRALQTLDDVIWRCVNELLDLELLGDDRPDVVDVDEALEERKEAQELVVCFVVVPRLDRDAIADLRRNERAAQSSYQWTLSNAQDDVLGTQTHAASCRRAGPSRGRGRGR